LRPKLRNRRGDFEAQITKPELPILRPKPGNPPPPLFWGSTKKPTTGFETKLGETVTTCFEAKLEKTSTTGFGVKLWETVIAGSEAKPLGTVAAGFEAKPLETVTTSFKAKPVKTVRVVLRPNHHHWFWGQTGENRLSGFEAKPLTNRCHRFWGPNRWETIPVILRPNHWQTVDLGFEAQPRNSHS
jgi:hypothetical protein